MKPSSLIAVLVGVLSLGMGPVTARAQYGYDPGYRGYGQPSVLDPGGYGQPGGAYGGGYGYAPVRPSDPYAGGYPTGPSSSYPADPRSYAPPAGSAPGGYGYAPIQPAVPYGGGYAEPDRVYQRGYSVFPAPPPVASGPISPLGPGVGNPALSAVVGLSGQLVRQVDDFLRAFAPNARVVPQGRQFLADASILRDAAARFQQMAASGAPPSALADQFGAVAASWQRFESRMEQVAKGRMGPNIAKILQMGGTVQQIQGLFP